MGWYKGKPTGHRPCLGSPYFGTYPYWFLVLPFPGTTPSTQVWAGMAGFFPARQRKWSDACASSHLGLCQNRGPHFGMASMGDLEKPLGWVHNFERLIWTCGPVNCLPARDIISKQEPAMSQGNLF